jgi:hypothetical protein
MSLLRLGAEVFHVEVQMDRHTDRCTEGRTDITELIVHFSQFCKRP